MDVYQLINSATFVGVGVGAFIVSYFVFNLITPFSLNQELAQNKNVAVAIVLASIFLGLAHIIASALY